MYEESLKKRTVRPAGGNITVIREEKGPGWPEGESQDTQHEALGEVRDEICALGTHLPLPVLEQNHFMPRSQNVLIYRITL